MPHTGLSASKTRARFLLLAAAFLFSTGGAAIKATALTSWQIAGGRSGVAALLLWFSLPGSRRDWTRWTWLIGTAYAATLILFVLANRQTTSANAIFLQSTAPLYMLLLGPLLLHERIRGVDLAVLLTVGAGAFLLLTGARVATVTAPAPRVGNLLALGAGATWALTIAGLRWLGKRSSDSAPAAATVIAGNLIAFAVCLPMALPVSHAGVTDLAWVLYLGAFQVSLAYIFLARSLGEVTGIEAATLLLIEPVFNPVWTWLLAGERPGGRAVAGGFLIIAAAFGGTVWRLRRSPG